MGAVAMAWVWVLVIGVASTPAATNPYNQQPLRFEQEHSVVGKQHAVGDDGDAVGKHLGPLTHFSFHAEPLVACPANNPAARYHPATTAVFGLWIILSLIFAAVTLSKFNSVQVFHRQLRNEAVSNSVWVWYFVTVLCRGACAVAQLTANLDDQHHVRVTEGLWITTTVFSLLGNMVLCMALYHQFVHRSSVPIVADVDAAAAAATEATPEQPLLSKRTSTASGLILNGTAHAPATGSMSLACYQLGPALVFFGECLLCIGFFVGQYLENEEPLYFWLFLASIWVQQVTEVVLVLRIFLSRPGPNEEGPDQTAKIFLLCGTLLTACNIFPPTVWQYWLPSTCSLRVATFVDLVQLADAASLLFLFLFLRREYIRNRESTIYKSLSTIQETLHPRAF